MHLAGKEHADPCGLLSLLRDEVALVEFGDIEEGEEGVKFRLGEASERR
jgi:hypothetical protein